MPETYQLFSWEHSYFSGKVRAYLRYKHAMGDLGRGYEDVLATPELIQGLLVPATGSPAVPQVRTPGGVWIQDSSEIIDAIERDQGKVEVVPSAEHAPRQAIASYLIELLADEWMVVPGFWERWHYSLDGVEPNHRAFNEQQWGARVRVGCKGHRAAGSGRGAIRGGVRNFRSAHEPEGRVRWPRSPRASHPRPKERGGHRSNASSSASAPTSMRTILYWADAHRSATSVCSDRCTPTSSATPLPVSG